MNTNSIDLFAGAGGWDLAAADFGYSPMGYEWWTPACDTREAAGLRTFQIDIRILGEKPCELLMASPPCQTFSVAAGSHQNPDDERTQLIWEPLRWMQFDTPIVVMEQVSPAASIFHTYANILASRGYHVAVDVANAWEYGVSQTRKRVILRASRHGAPRSMRRTTAPAWNEILGVEGTLESNYRGGGRDPLTGKWILGRREMGQIGFAVTGKAQKLILADGTKRRMTAAEAGLLQGFPADFPWQGTAQERWQQVGNAIPVPLARAILESML